MKAPPIPKNEDQRLAALRRLEILDFSPEERFDRITRLAQHLFDVPITMINLVDSNNVHAKSCQGLPKIEIPRAISFCGHAILEKEPLVIPDMLLDERFADNPFVANEFQIRFYAGYPLSTLDGYRVGTLCIMDQRPRQLSEQALASLQDLARMVENELNYVRIIAHKDATLQKAHEELERRVEERTTELAQTNIALKREITERKQVEAILRQQEEQFRLIFELAPTGMVILAPDGQFLRVNQTYCDMVSYSAEELLERNFTELTHPNDIEPNLRLNQKLWQGEISDYQMEKRYQHKDGHFIHVLLQVSLTRNADSQPLHFVGQIVDISDRIRAEAALRASEAHFRTIVQTSPIPMLVSRKKDGLVLYANKPLGDLIGLSTDELIGDKTPNYYDDPADRKALLDKINKEGVVRNYEACLKKADGTLFWAILTIQPMTFAGEPALFSGVYDITVRKQAEAELIHFTNQLRAAADISNQINTILDPDQLLHEVIDLLQMRFNFYHVHIYLLEEAGKYLYIQAGSGEIGRQLYEQNHKIAMDHEQSIVVQAARRQEIILVNDTSIEPNFLPNPLLPETQAEVAVPILAGRQLLGVFDIQDNQSDRFRVSDLDTLSTVSSQIAIALENARLFAERASAEAVLRESEARLRTVITNTPIILYMTDRDGIFTLSEGRALERLGLMPNQTVGLSIFDLYAENQTFLENIQAILAGEERVWIAEINGLVYESQGAPLRDETGQLIGMIGVGMDVTEQRQAEEALRDSDRRLAQFLEAMPIGVLVADKDTTPFYANQVAQEIFGAEIASGIPQEPLTSIYPIYVADTEQTYPPNQLPVIQALAGKRITINDMEVHQEQKIIPVEAKTTPILDKNGQIVYGVVAIQDITERKQIERDLTQALNKALEANRLKTELLARVSHELRTPLNAIIGYTDLLQESVYGPLAKKQQDTVERIFINGKKLMHQINNLLDQAQIERGTIKLHIAPFRPIDLIDNIQSVLEPAARDKGLNFSAYIAKELPDTLWGDLQRLQDILINLVGNAIKFTDRGSVDLQLYQADDMYWALQVRDTGQGIPAEAQSYIFESFRQVDGSMTRQHDGVGLGLSIVRRLTTQMGGDISLKSTVGKGSIFTVTLPFDPEQEPSQ